MIEDTSAIWIERAMWTIIPMWFFIENNYLWPFFVVAGFLFNVRFHIEEYRMRKNQPKGSND